MDAALNLTLILTTNFPNHCKKEIIFVIIDSAPGRIIENAGCAATAIAAAAAAAATHRPSVPSVTLHPQNVISKYLLTLIC